MGWLIGMDEAGYGPNLGPLVITATVWEVPGKPRESQLWELLADVLTNAPVDGDGRLHVADSKEVYSPARGRFALERGVLAALGMLSAGRPATFRGLCSQLAGAPALSAQGAAWGTLGAGADGAEAGAESTTSLQHSLQHPGCPKLHPGCDASGRDATEPWFAEDDLPLPTDANLDEARSAAERWSNCCGRTGVRLHAVRCDIVFTPRFNRMVAERGNKASALSHLSLRLLRSVWDPETAEPTLVIADKHGGRDRYEAVLTDALDGQLPVCRAEGRERSEYRVGATDIRFQTRAEEHLPVALASMVSKYVRETAMDVFNGWWRKRVPNLQPTKGYPTDAVRFREAIAPTAAALGIADHVLWRCR